MLRSGNRYRNGALVTSDDILKSDIDPTNAATNTVFGLADGTTNILHDDRARTVGGELPAKEMEVEIHREKTELRQQHLLHQTNVNMNVVKSVIFVNTFLYAVCYWIQMGVLPVCMQC